MRVNLPFTIVIYPNSDVGPFPLAPILHRFVNLLFFQELSAASFTPVNVKTAFNTFFSGLLTRLGLLNGSFGILGDLLGSFR